MNENRPDPQAILKALNDEVKKSHKGRLKIFLGMSAGVGKTYAMLQEAHEIVSAGGDVLVGVVETHGRKDTEQLLKGLKILPQKEIEYRDSRFKELDLDKILELRPKLVLIDELAHTNVPGSRHPKRWQDVVEVIDNGIDVFSALNVQHIESLKDYVEAVAEIPIRETVPDLVIEMADSIELIDITPPALLQRLKEGKVYLGERSQTALKNFFREDRLTALREMALRFAAEKIDHDRRGMNTLGQKLFTWKTRERLLVIVNPNESSQKLIRTTRRLAFILNAPWIALWINSRGEISDDENKILETNLSLARDLGAEVITTKDLDEVQAIQRIASEQRVTQIVLDHPVPSKFLGFFYRSSFVDKLSAVCEDLDIHILHQTGNKNSYKKKNNFFFKKRFYTYFFLLAAGCLLSLINYYIPEHIYYYLAFYIPLSLALAISVDGFILQRQMLAQRESSVQSLYKISKEISMAPSAELVLPLVEKELGNLLGGICEIMVKTPEGLDFSETKDLKDNDKEKAVAVWVLDNETEAGWSTSTLPMSKYFYLPIKGFTRVVGVLGFHSDQEVKLSIETKNFLYTAGVQIGSHIERLFIEKSDKDITGLHRKEKSYHSILNLISEQLKLPIEKLTAVKQEVKDNLLNPIITNLSHIRDNILAMTKHRTKSKSDQKNFYQLEEVIESSIESTEKETASYDLKVNIEPNLPQMIFDFYLIQILISNLIFNAIENSNPGAVISLEARAEEGNFILSVIDEGRGLKKDLLKAAFETFNRLPEETNANIGMGLSIAKTIAEIHGGVIIASQTPTGGNKNTLYLPLNT